MKRWILWIGGEMFLRVYLTEEDAEDDLLKGNSNDFPECYRNIKEISKIIYRPKGDGADIVFQDDPRIYRITGEELRGVTR